ncbi:MAG: hypothetical protein ACK2TS_02420, partial [Anaerolineales bacterium]
TFHNSADGFLLLEFMGEPNQLVLQGVNLLDGSLKDEKVVPFKAISGDFYSAPELIGWQGDVLYFSLETRLYAIDTLTGEILVRY